MSVLLAYLANFTFIKTSNTSSKNQKCERCNDFAKNAFFANRNNSRFTKKLVITHYPRTM